MLFKEEIINNPNDGQAPNTTGSSEHSISISRGNVDRDVYNLINSVMLDKSTDNGRHPITAHDIVTDDLVNTGERASMYFFG